MWLCLCPMSLHPTIPCHPTLSPRTPGCPSAAPGQGWDVGAGGGCGTRVPSVPQFPCGPCYVPAPPWLCPQLCGIPAGHRMGTFAQGAQDKDTKGSLVGATTNWAAPSLCHCRARGHLGDTSGRFLLAVGSSRETEAGGHGGIWEPRGPRAEQAQPSLPALFIASTAMCRTCAAARAGAGVSPGCACSGLCPGALTTSGALGNLVPAHTVGFSRHRDPATCPQALGLSGCQHNPACGQSCAERGGHQLPMDHGSHILPCASLRE